MVDIKQIKGILDLFPMQHIFVLGDLMIDEYLWGKTERISPEAPVQIVEVDTQASSLGGAGNVVANLVSLGGKVSVAGIIGLDTGGQWIKKTLHQMGVNYQGIIEDNKRPTTKKTRVIAAHQQVVRIDWEKRDALTQSQEAKLLDYIKEHIDVWDAIIISDYNKGLLTKKLLSNVINEANLKSKWIIIDPKGSDYSRYRGAGLITPNKKEALLTVLNGDDKDLKIIGLNMINELELKGLIITLGQDGMYVFSHQDKPKIIPTKARAVYDVSGAGDTVVATLALCLAEGIKLTDAAFYANLTAGIVVGKVGTAVVNPAEILEFLGESYFTFNKKIISGENFIRIIKTHRSKGQKIAFTNGCFDLLHTGHIKLLHEAKSFADILIVGLNSDSSVRRLKGLSRPCLNQDERAQILSSLDCVDYVIIFEEDTPLELIELIGPDILVKGADYNVDGVVGAEFVKKNGGSVRLIDLVKYRSTSGIIKEIIEKHQD